MTLHTQIKEYLKTGKEPKLYGQTRKGFGKGLAQIRSEKLVVLTANLKGSTHVKDFAKKNPSRFIDVGVAEQSMMGVAAGLASEGYTSVATSFAVFNPGRNWDFFRTQVAMNNLPVVVVGSHAGLATEADGATHQALEDVAMLRSLPGVSIISPIDAGQAQAAIKKAVSLKSPVYLRLARANTPQILAKAEYEVGKTYCLVPGKKILLLCSGITAWECIQAAKELKKLRKDVGVIAIPTIKPLAKLNLKGTQLIFTVEDHSSIGGLGSAVAEQVAEAKKRPRVVRIGTKKFGSSGTMSELYAEHNIDATHIVKQVLKEMKR